MSVEDIVDGLAIIQQKRGRIVDQGDVEMLALAIKELRKGRPWTTYRAERVPTGWVLVPKVPTEAMLVAGDALLDDTVECSENVYLAMLAAIERELPHGERS